MKKVIFAEGCFDEFEGTPQELQDLVALIHSLNESGELEADSVRLDAEEEFELLKLLDNRKKRN